ncbi:hypothetical protein LOC68_22680 [Blastopirellula sp. JC732]|uniref:Uncharacterized protein n=1 Tax=Blastopirellula sediminis TaxID=2894196 RepID=A0A9X1MPY9_9BACT|nr:hypothetical protein [Blastopirellula sediminis]MCC9605492.1 hypothetical protein [Blastopirellula sediminis]MCC9631208.1 hypothetical protein [Blastopirellula sediminis]
MKPEVSERQERFQFGIWHLILATAIAAVIATATAPLLREFNLVQWLTLGCSAAGVAFGVLSFAAIVLVPRYQASINGGPLLFEFPAHASRETVRDMKVSAALAWSTLLLYVLYFFSLDRAADARHSLIEFVSPLFLTMVIALSFCNALFAARRPQLREYGVLIGTVFTPWEKVDTCYWSRTSPDQLRIGGPLVADVTVSANHCTQVENILQRKINSYIVAEPVASPNLNAGERFREGNVQP